MTTQTITLPETQTQTQTETQTQIGASDGPRTLLRIEGALVLAGSIAAYFSLGGGWGWLAALFLAPDLALLGYLAGPTVGAAFYNFGHSYIAPLLLGAAGFFLATSAAHVLTLGALIWAAHIGFDRMLGYGLKHASSFRDTHLGRIGKD